MTLLRVPVNAMKHKNAQGFVRTTPNFPHKQLAKCTVAKVLCLRLPAVSNSCSGHFWMSQLCGFGANRTHVGVALLDPPELLVDGLHIPECNINLDYTMRIAQTVEALF